MSPTPLRKARPRTFAPQNGETDLEATPEAKAIVHQAKALHAVANAADGIAEAVNRLAAAHETATLQRRDFDSFFGQLAGMAGFIGRNRLKIAASIPAILTAIGAVAPNAAKALGEALQAMGVQ